MIHRGAVLPEGKWCENAICKILRQCGVGVVDSTPQEDCLMKVDFWVRFDPRSQPLPIQFSTNRKLLTGEKGADALRRGVIPVWVDAKMVEQAVETGDGSAVVNQFREYVRSVIQVFQPRIIAFPRRPIRVASEELFRI